MQWSTITKKNMGLNDTLHRITTLIKQHDNLKQHSNIAKWVQRTTMIYVHHVDDLTKNMPERVLFT
jgi:Tfp pilus assembly protein PilN